MRRQDWIIQGNKAITYWTQVVNVKNTKQKQDFMKLVKGQNVYMKKDIYVTVALMVYMYL